LSRKNILIAGLSCEANLSEILFSLKIT
jgi:hypothetical protein